MAKNMTPLIRSQILDIRDTGLTNMFDVNMVQKIADDFGYYDLVVYLMDNRKEYAEFIMYGDEDSSEK